MKNPEPKISVIIPLFNREDLIAETLDSLLAQGFKNWECIVVDDHSEDKSVSVVKEFVQRDSRFSAYLRPGKLRKGANSCRNYGLEKAVGEFVYWLDSDDIVHPNFMEFSLEVLENSSIDYVRFSRFLFFGTFERKFFRNEKIQPGEYLVSSPDLIEAMLLNELEFNTCNVVWRRKSLRGTFCEEIVYADEWEFYSRLLASGLKGRNLENTLIFGRKHNSSTTAEFRLKNPVRLSSKIKAMELVLNTLAQYNLMTPRLKKFFLQMGFRLKSPGIIQKSLVVSDATHFERLKYRLGYWLYPVLRPIFRFKSKTLKI